MAWSGLVCSVIGLLCVSFLFQAVGYSTPLWTASKTDTSNVIVHVGLWYVMACVNDEPNSCQSKAIVLDFTFQSSYTPTELGAQLSSYSSYTRTELEAQLTVEYFESYVYWVVLAIVVSVTIGLTSLATLIVICCRCAGVHSKGWFVCAAILLLLGSLLGLATSIVYAVAFGMVFSFNPDYINGATFPWSVLLFGLGCIIAFIAAIILIVVLCKWRKYGEYYESDDVSDRDIRMDDVGLHNPRYEDNTMNYMGDRNDASKGYSSNTNGRDYVRNTGGRDYVRSTGGREHDGGHRRDDYSGRRDDMGSSRREYDQPYPKERDYRQTGNDNMYRPYSQKYSY